MVTDEVELLGVDVGKSEPIAVKELRVTSEPYVSVTTMVGSALISGFSVNPDEEKIDIDIDSI